MELKDTIKKMLSDDYRDRLDAEAQQLYIRMNRLEDAIQKEEESDQQRLYMAQHDIMQAYLHILLARAEASGHTILLEE